MPKTEIEEAGFRKGRGTRDQIANICWITEKAREFQKNIYFCFINYAKAFDPGIKPRFPTLQADSLPSEPPENPFYGYANG